MRLLTFAAAAAYMALNLVYGDRRFASVNAVMLAGCLCNAAAIFANGRKMPVAGEAFDETPTHKPVDGHTKLRLLCDLMPIRWVNGVLWVSVGDVLIAGAMLGYLAVIAVAYSTQRL